MGGAFVSLVGQAVYVSVDDVVTPVAKTFGFREAAFDAVDVQPLVLDINTCCGITKVTHYGTLL
jgi:hypothetical protein